MKYEYKTVGAPEKGKRKRGLRSLSDRVAAAFEVRTGNSARIVVAVVMRQGRMRRLPASSVAARIAGTSSGFLRANESFR